MPKPQQQTAHTYPDGVIPPSTAFPWPTLHIDVHALLANTTACMAAGVPYHLGAKAPSLSCKPSALVKGGIDCSGFVRRALYQFGDIAIPDGSVVQREWIEKIGFKASDVASAKADDGAVRIAFLTPADGGGVGHVVLVTGGRTAESHGGTGPDRRPWTGQGWQGKAKVYVLSPPVPKG